MISFFRRALSSWIVLGLLGLIMIAFIVTGVGTPSGLGNLGGGASGDTIAKIGSDRLASSEAVQRAQVALQNVQQQQPEVTMAAFVQQGGVESLVQQLIEAKAIERWADEQHIVASKRLVDGEIASIPAFHGLTGKFDETVYRNMLAQRRISEAQFRHDMVGDALRRQVLVPVSGSMRAPQSLALPYASLMLESRRGLIGIVPSELMPSGSPPTEADLTAWYGRNLSRYTIPERRVIRYALISKGQLKALPQVSDAEITAFYNANAAEYGATQTRSFSQVVLPDEKAANAFVAKVKGGTSFADAAKAAGFTPADTALGDRTQSALTELASADVAKAAFAIPQGGTTNPVKSALGWHILHVDAIKSTASKPLSAVRDTIAESLSKQKTDEAIANLIADIEDQIADGSTFDDVVKARGLKVVTTAPILPNGSAPEDPAWKSAPELQVLLKPAFEGSTDDDPTVENIGNGEFHALLKIDRIVPSAPAPLARIKDRVTSDMMVDRASARAQTIAKAIVAKVDGGTSLDKAIAEAGVKLPPPQPAGGRQIDMIQSGKQVPPPLALMFSMKAGQTKVLEAPDKKGWFVVHLDSIAKGDAATVPGLVQSTQSEFSQMMAEEFQQQFSASIAKAVGVSRNDAAVARLKRELIGAGSQ
jgi:peptidyl-prolyl cis-trans isomerase D